MLAASPLVALPRAGLTRSAAPSAASAARLAQWGAAVQGGEPRNGAPGHAALAGLTACLGAAVLPARRRVVGAKACWRGPHRRTATARVALAAGAGKPERTTLYTKAGPDGASLGDCPFSHSVQMALRLKGVDFDVVPCTQETKPQWLLDEVDGKMPCVCHEGVPHVETSEILSWIEAEFPEPSLVFSDDLSDNAKSGFGIFPSLARFTKNTDPSKDDDLRIDLQIKIAGLRGHLARFHGKFLWGDEPTLLDCKVLPALYILENATAHFKNFSLESYARGDEVREYFARGSALPAFADSVYPSDVCIWGWTQARGGE